MGKNTTKLAHLIFEKQDSGNYVMTDTLNNRVKEITPDAFSIITSLISLRADINGYHGKNGDTY